jgi:tetratricopeptide (TPR) repeat protein
MKSRYWAILLVGLTVLCLLGVGLYQIPPVHERLAWRIDSLRTQILHTFNPPEQVVFVPQEQVDAIVQATLQALAPSATASPLPSATPTPPGLTSTPLPSLTPTTPPTPLPSSASLSGIRHEWQQMNNCGPTTLAMALSYWGWEGDQTDTRAFLRPNFRVVDDKNVNPDEMKAYIESQTQLKAIIRVGGDLETIKGFLAAGFPVVIEKGLQHSPKDWMGHYVLFASYDDANQQFLTYDSYTGPGVNVKVPYSDMDGSWWRDFNYLYLVIFPPEREAEVLAILGPQADPVVNFQAAADKARQETLELTGRDLYFAWYNLGSNLVALQDFSGASQAYDQAFALYPSIVEDDRPWRMLWYQTGPYPAYYYTGRYQDVINLGNQTLSLLGKPILEETLYWMGMAQESQGDLDKAISDYKKAVDINPDSTAARQELIRLGVEYP